MYLTALLWRQDNKNWLGTNLSAEAYISVLYRFVSHTGLRHHIYADCETNFVAASSELRKIIQNFFKEKKTQKAIKNSAMKIK